MNEDDFAAHLVRGRRLGDSWRDNLDVLPEQAIDHHIKGELQVQGCNKEEPIPENKSINEFGYFGPAHHDVRRMSYEALEVHKEGTLRRLIDDTCETVVLGLFKEAHECANICL